MLRNVNQIFLGKDEQKLIKRIRAANTKMKNLKEFSGSGFFVNLNMK